MHSILYTHTHTHTHTHTQNLGASQVALVVKNPLAHTGDVRDMGSIPGSGGSPGVGNGNPLEYSYLESAMDRGAWRAAVQEATKSQTPLSG